MTTKFYEQFQQFMSAIEEEKKVATRYVKEAMTDEERDYCFDEYLEGYADDLNKLATRDFAYFILTYIDARNPEGDEEVENMFRNLDKFAKNL